MRYALPNDVTGRSGRNRSPMPVFVQFGDKRGDDWLLLKSKWELDHEAVGVGGENIVTPYLEKPDAVAWYKVDSANGRLEAAPSEEVDFVRRYVKLNTVLDAIRSLHAGCRAVRPF